ncbi:MAG: cytochrome c maturation protein CcmE [Dehalococcoidia bacterium]|nr:cytochrome c maturation protein CcmE [Dehalococcoidia bacterium]
MKNHKKLIIGGAIIIVAVAVLGYIGVMGSGTYYYEVSEFLGQSTLMTDKITSINGEISTDLTMDDFVFQFTLLDATGLPVGLPVVYQGQVPNAFEPGRLAVVKGKLDATGVFQATSIITKCTSKD